MGGIVSSPKKPKVDYTAVAQAQAEEEKKKSLERQRRGVESTIKTSYSGILTPKEGTSQRKNLLGE